MFTFLAGRKVAIDASMSLYQFLIAVRSDGAQLVGSDGETTRCGVCVCVCMQLVYACTCVCAFACAMHLSMVCLTLLPSQIGL